MKHGVMVFLMVCFTGCAIRDVGFLIPENCTMTAWHQGVDGLADPPYLERYHTGDEFTLVGIVRDADSCMPLEDVTVMFDMTNHEGEYDGVQRGTVYTNALGFFTIRSDRPGAYGGGPPHIHLFVGKDAYETITTAYNLLDDSAMGWIETTLSAE